MNYEDLSDNGKNVIVKMKDFVNKNKNNIFYGITRPTENPEKIRVYADAVFSNFRSNGEKVMLYRVLQTLSAIEGTNAKEFNFIKELANSKNYWAPTFSDFNSIEDCKNTVKNIW